MRSALSTTTSELADMPIAANHGGTFGTGGGVRMAEQYGVALLGALPLDIRIREETDAGRPTVIADPDGPVGRAYLETARHTAARLSIASATAPAAPRITVEDT